jgi:hypothetical protein
MENVIEFVRKIIFRVEESVKKEADEKRNKTEGFDSPTRSSDFTCDAATKQVFQPGGIHKPEAVEFWRSELQANQWVLDVLEKGYVIPFEKAPAEYDEDNNLSAKKQMEFVRQSVMDLKSAGIVKFVDEKPWCVSPLTVSEKLESDGTKKLRLCWDGSRCVNLCLKEQKVTLAHLQRALELTEKDDYQVTYDLKSAYHHIQIHDLQTKFLGAAFLTEDGRRQYFIFLYLPFGLASAVHCITKLMKPINSYLHASSIRHSIFIDDGRILSKGQEKAEEDRKFVYDVLTKAGWTIEQKKSDSAGDASQEKCYLGFVINTVSLTVRLKTDKKEAIKQSVLKTLDFDNQKIQIRELAKTLGKMVSCEPALGQMPLMAARAAYIQLDQVTEIYGWNGTLVMNHDTKNSLRFFVENVDRFDDTPIRSAAREISVLSIIGPPSNFLKTSYVTNHLRTNCEEIWASDSSGFATCAYSIKADKDVYYRGTFSDEEKGFSSGHRELLAVKKTLENYSSVWSDRKEATNIYWITDSENLVHFLSKGSGKIHIQQEIFKIMLLCKKLNIRIIPIHVLREDPRIKVADEGSKVEDTDDWKVDVGTFLKFNKSMQFSIDLFASDWNSKCPRFYSNFWCKNTLGIDAFSHDWSGEVAWVCPPIKLVLKTIRKIRQTKVCGVLFVPDWQTADYWPEIFEKNRKLKFPFTKIEICRPFLIQNVFDYRSPLSGNVKFDFLAVYFFN